MFALFYGKDNTLPAKVKVTSLQEQNFLLGCVRDSQRKFGKGGLLVSKMLYIISPKETMFPGATKQKLIEIRVS